MTSRSHLPLAVLLGCCLSACGGSVDDAPDEWSTDEPIDYVATPEDFTCLHGAVRVEQTWIRNPLGQLDESVAVAKAGMGEFPVGTILQLVPQEAMVKRAAGFSPETLDWELFFLETHTDGSTTILERGRDEVSGPFGRCVDCHGQAAPEHDFTCRTGQGCDDMAHMRPVFDWLVKHDSRCGA